MGAAESMLNKFTGSDEQKKKAEDQLKLTYKEVDAENNKFYYDVLYSNVESNRVIPIQAVLYKKAYIKIMNTVDAQTEAANGITNLISDISNSNISGAIGGVLNTAVTALLGNRSMSYSKKIGYSLNIGKLGGVERIDYLVSSRSYSSQSWKKIMTNCLSGVLIFSSCDVDKLKANDATVLVQNCFKNESLIIQANIKQLLNISLDTSITEKMKREKQKPVIEELKRLYEDQAAQQQKKIQDQNKPDDKKPVDDKNPPQPKPQPAEKDKKAGIPQHVQEGFVSLNQKMDHHLQHTIQAQSKKDSHEVDATHHRKILHEASTHKFDLLEKHLDHHIHHGLAQHLHHTTPVNYEKGCLLSSALIYHVHALIAQKNYAKAAHSLWQAWRLNPENLECIMLLENVGIFIPLNLEDITDRKSVV